MGNKSQIEFSTSLSADCEGRVAKLASDGEMDKCFNCAVHPDDAVSSKQTNNAGDEFRMF